MNWIQSMNKCVGPASWDKVTTDNSAVLVNALAELTVVGSGGGTALNTAIAQGHEDIEQMLRDAGATR